MAKSKLEVVLTAVNYELTVEEAVRLGRYNHANLNITSAHFSLISNEQGLGKRQVEITLFRFGKWLSTEQAIAELDKLGYRPATARELLALGAQHPNLQRTKDIVALGSIWTRPSDNRFVVYLWGPAGDRWADLYLCEGDWFGGWWFAAVSK